MLQENYSNLSQQKKEKEKRPFTIMWELKFERFMSVLTSHFYEGQAL